MLLANIVSLIILFEMRKTLYFCLQLYQPAVIDAVGLDFYSICLNGRESKTINVLCNYKLNYGLIMEK